MPSVKIPRKSTATDMTPFVDVAFLILAFFMLATKFKPPEPVPITTPHSVSAAKLKEQDGILISFDSAGHVYLTMNVQKQEDNQLKYDLLNTLNQSRKLGLSDAEMKSFENNSMIGASFTTLKSVLDLPNDQRDKAKQSGIPIDSANNELSAWLGSANTVFAGRKGVDFMIKGDNNAKYPSFKGVIDALRANEIFKYKLITDPKGVPDGTELYKMREQGKGGGE